MISSGLMKNTETVERTSGDELRNEDSTVQKRDCEWRKALSGSKCKDRTSFAGGDIGGSGLAIAGWNATG
jgi:hypothetical protein